MYTWNWKTGHLNQISTIVGLDLTGWILSPGRWVQHNAKSFWARYIYLIGVRQENEDLAQKINELELEVMRVQEQARSAERMASLLRFTPDLHWERRACRIIGQKLGPNAVLETIMVDLGSRHGAQVLDPVITTKGVVGRIAKTGLNFSTVLLITDPMSKIPVVTTMNRAPAILQGQGPGAPLEVKFISHNMEISPGEILLTSGQGGVFPKGIPIARITKVKPADISLFQEVHAESLLNLRTYEELLVLSKTQPPVLMMTNSSDEPQSETNNNTAPINS